MSFKNLLNELERARYMPDDIYAIFLMLKLDNEKLYNYLKTLNPLPIKICLIEDFNPNGLSRAGIGTCHKFNQNDIKLKFHSQMSNRESKLMF